MPHLFVYGTLKQGYGNNRILRGAEFIGKGVTLLPFLMKDTGGFPVVLRSNGPDAEPIHNISGELYEINDEQLNRCDQLEGHPDWYCREEVAVDIADTGIQQMAWMYIGVPGRWNRNLHLCHVHNGAYVWGRHEHV